MTEEIEMNQPSQFSKEKEKMDAQEQEGTRNSWADKEEECDNKLEWKEAENIIILSPVIEKADHKGRKPPPRLDSVLAAIINRNNINNIVNNIFLGISLFLICMHFVFQITENMLGTVEDFTHLHLSQQSL